MSNKGRKQRLDTGPLTSNDCTGAPVAWVKGGQSIVHRLMRIVAMAGICVGGLLWAAPAYAYGPNAPVISVNVSVVIPGGSLIVSGSGFQPGEAVTLQLFSTPVTVGTTSVDSGGTFSTSVTIPASTPLGNHTIVATGTTGDTASTSIVVVSTTASGLATGGTATGGTAGGTSGSSSGGSLAFTGADIAAMAGVGAIALALGGMLVFAGRRRRVTANHP
jgi:hypothetical protein